MASLSELSRARKAQVRSLQTASRRLDSAQEALERECKRLLTRKRSVPEASDAARLSSLAQGVESALSSMVSLIATLSSAWT